MLRTITRGCVGLIMLWMLWGWTVPASGQTLLTGEYFIDTDPGPGMGLPITASGSEWATTIEIPLTGLSPGLHTLAVRFKQDNGSYGTVTATLFAVNAPAEPADPGPPHLPLARSEYFFGADPGPGNGTPIPPHLTAFEVPLPADSAGTYRFGLRTADLRGAWGVAQWHEVTASLDTLLTLAATASTWMPEVAETVGLTATASEPGGTTWWDVSAADGTLDGEADEVAGSWSVSFATPGIYSVVAHHHTDLDLPVPAVRYAFDGTDATDQGGAFADLDGFEPATGAFGDPFSAAAPMAVAVGGDGLGLASFTLSYWVKYADASAGAPLQVLAADGSGYTGLSTSSYTAGQTLFGTTFPAGPSSVLTNGAWHHVALAKWEDGTVHSYVDGSFKGSGSVAAGLTLDSLLLQPSAALDNIEIFSEAMNTGSILALAETENRYVSRALTLTVGSWDTAIIANSPTTFCEGDSVELIAPNGESVLWSDGSSGASRTVEVAGVYTALVTLAGGFTFETDPISVTVEPVPAPLVVMTADAPPGSAYLVDESDYPVHSYLWANGDTLSSATGLAAGAQSVQIFEGNCSISLPFEILPATTADIQDIVGFQWYVDGDFESATFVSVAPGSDISPALLLDTEGIPAGAHQLHVAAVRADGMPGPVSTHLFTLSDFDPAAPVDNTPDAFVAAEYFFDADPGVGAGIPVAVNGGTAFAEVVDVNTAGLLPGSHILGMRFQNAAGQWGTLTTLSFLVEFPFPPNFPDFPVPMVAAEYFLDGEDPGVGQATPLPISPLGPESSWPAVIDVSSLAAGGHSLHVRTRNVAGDWSFTRSNDFEVAPVDDCLPPEVTIATLETSGNSVTLAASATGASSPSWSWDFNGDGEDDAFGDQATHDFGGPGAYLVRATLTQGVDGACSASAVAAIQVGDVLSTEVAVDGPTVFCAGEATVLEAPVGTGHVWSDLTESSSLVVTETGDYQCFYIDANGNPAASDIVSITVHPVLTFAATAYGTLPGAATGSAFVEPTGGTGWSYSYNWSNGSETHAATDLPSGEATVTVSDGVCPVIATVNIPALSEPMPPADLVAAEYFWDGVDPGVGEANPLPSPTGLVAGMVADIPTEGLTPGGHVLHVRFQRADGAWGMTRRLQVSVWATEPTPAEDPALLVAGEYWFGDEDPGAGEGMPIAGAAESVAFQADLSGLTPGPHMLNVRMKNDRGHWGTVQRQAFLIQSEWASPAAETVLMAAEYFITPADQGAPGPAEANALAWTAFTPTADAALAVPLSGLAPGDYRLHIRTQSHTGAWSVTRSASFAVESATCVMPQASFTWTEMAGDFTAEFHSTSASVLPEAALSWDFDGDGVWDAAGDSATHVFSHAGPHTVLLRVTQQECSNVVSAVVVLGDGNDWPVMASATELCAGEVATLEAPTGASNVVWNTGESGPVLTATATGTYWCAFDDAAGVPRLSAPANLTVHPAVDFTLDVFHPSTGAANGSAQITSSGGSSFPLPISWSTGATTAYASGLAAGQYSVSINDSHCPVDTNFTLVAGTANDGVVKLMTRWDNAPDSANHSPLLVPIGSPTGIFTGISTAGLEPGVHILHVRPVREDGTWGFVTQAPVHLSEPWSPDDTPAASLVAAEFFFDDADPGPGAGISAVIGENGLEVDSLAPGAHTISARVYAADGSWSTTQVGAFTRCTPPAPPQVAAAALQACEGESLTLEALSADGVHTWTRPDGSTATGLALTLNDLTLEDAGVYTVTRDVEGGCASAPTSVVVSIPEVPELTSLIDGPAAACPTGDPAVFYVTPVSSAVFYDWSFPAGAVIETGNNTNNVSVNFADVTESAWTVALTVSNACGSAAAAPFYLPITCEDVVDPPVDCPEDVDEDGLVTVSDLLLVLGEFGCTADCGRADISGDGMVTVNDLLELLGSFGDPCPE